MCLHYVVRLIQESFYKFTAFMNPFKFIALNQILAFDAQMKNMVDPQFFQPRTA